MRSQIRITLALAAALGALGCGDGGTGPAGVALGGNGTVAITVSGGVTPTFTWTGGNASKLSVAQSTGGGVFWDIEALNSGTGFAGPVVHGIVPSTAREMTADAALAGGVNYTAHLTLVNGSVGSQVFRP